MTENSSNNEPKTNEETFSSLSDLDKMKYLNKNMANVIHNRLIIKNAELLSNFIQSYLFHTDYKRNKLAASFYNDLNDNQKDSIDDLAKNYYELKEKTCTEYVGKLIRENKTPVKKGYSRIIETITTHIYKDILTGKLYELEKFYEIGKNDNANRKTGGKKSRKIQKKSKRITYKK